MNRVVSNATPLIVLDRIRHLHLLEKIYRKVYVPQAVFKEVSNFKYPNDIFKENPFIEVMQIREQGVLYPNGLHCGELEVCILAKEINASVCILDDLVARRYAAGIGLNVVGSIGILLLAKELKLIGNIKELLDGLTAGNFRISQKLYEEALKRANEE